MEKGICLCGTEFIKKHINHKYCSNKCKNHFNNRRPYIINCKNCDKEFHPFNKLNKFCSSKCAFDFKSKNSNPTRRVKSIIKICEYCKKEFHPYSMSKGNFCSAKCYWDKIREEKKEPEKKKCEICGTEFIPWTSKNFIKRPQQRFCSHKCSGIGITQLKKTKINIKNWEKRKAGGKTNHLDNLWRFAIYKQGKNECEYCGKKESLNAHHIFSRSNFSVRWDIDNGVCLCVSHHIFGIMSFHKSPIEMLEWIKQKRGIEWYNRLLEKSHVIMKVKDVKEKFYNILSGGQYDKITKKHLEELEVNNE